MIDPRLTALAGANASPEMVERLDIFIGLLARWRRIINLVSESTFSAVWTRHVADSAQILPLAPRSRRWVDLGSGAGFPGLVIAIQLAGMPEAEVHCIESDQRKCAFLREVVRATGAPAHIHAARIESITPRDTGEVNAVTARALAPLDRLVGLARPWLERGAVGVFPRGRTAAEEMHAFSVEREFQIESHPSKLDADARIVRVNRVPQVLL